MAKMSIAKIGKTGVSVQKIDVTKFDEETQALTVMEFLIKILVYFPKGIVLSKFNDLFITVFETITPQNESYLPLAKQAKEAMLEWGWLIETKVEAPKSQHGFYKVIKLNPDKVKAISDVLTDTDYDGWLEIAMTNVIEDQPKSSASPSTSKGFDKFRAKVEKTETDIPF